MIGVAVGRPATRLAKWRAERGATHPSIIHAPAAMWLGPACNYGFDPTERLVSGWEVEGHPVTCARCLALPGGAR